MKKAKLRRHESFPIREGWIEKGLTAIKNDSASAFGKVSGIKALGIGANMVKALKYWMMASNIISNGVKPSLTEFGNQLYDNDPYLENELSWWLVHYYLSTNFDESPVIYYIFNIYKGNHLDKIELKEEICDYLKRNEIEYNEKLVYEDVSMFFRLYYNDNKNQSPEDNMSSPLAKLHLIEKDINNVYYIKKSATLENLCCEMIGYVLQESFDNEFEIADVYNREKSACKVFNLDKGIFNQYIVQLRNKGYITVNKTAGLNTVYFEKKLSIKDLYEEYEEK